MRKNDDSNLRSGTKIRVNKAGLVCMKTGRKWHEIAGRKKVKVRPGCP